MEIFSSAATLGIFGAFCSEYIIEGFRAVEGIDYGTIVATVGGGIGMWLCMTIARKAKWLKEYALGIAMLIGLIVAIVTDQMFM